MAWSIRTAIPETVAPTSHRNIPLYYCMGRGSRLIRGKGDNESLTFRHAAFGNGDGEGRVVIGGLEGVARGKGGGGDYLDVGGRCGSIAFGHGWICFVWSASAARFISGLHGTFGVNIYFPNNDNNRQNVKIKISSFQRYNLFACSKA